MTEMYNCLHNWK